MTIRILIGDVRDRLKDLPDESVHCVVTSPPYFGLRDYATGQWDGGEAGCDHLKPRPAMPTAGSTQGLGRDRATSGGKFHDSAAPKPILPQQFLQECGKCGARRVDNQIGLEPTPDAYVATMAEVFREVRRVLRKDGTLWLNLGDSYAREGGPVTAPGATAMTRNTLANVDTRAKQSAPGGLKPKDLIGIPWRVAFALQADGWWLRQDIIWHKPNPMPESVRDRCTKAHEYVFLLTKSERYFYDAEAISEPAVQDEFRPSFRGGAYVNNATFNNGEGGRSTDTGNIRLQNQSRNKRSVWTITTQPFAEAHFATFPPELPELCIKAGCPKGGTVLDPFGGAGTTGLVADRLGRNAILIELNPEYASIAKNRLDSDGGMFMQVAAE